MRTGWRPGVLLLVVAAVAIVGCGKKGPPLPPLVQLPVAPGEFTAVRRGDTVDLTFKVPASNTDRSAPADIARVDVYAWTVPGPVVADEVVRRGARIGSVPINEPPDDDEPAEERPRKEGTADQDAVAAVQDTLQPGASDSYRAYVAVGVNRRGRRGALSDRIAVPLVAPPPAPAQPRVTYTEDAITIAWSLVSPRDGDPALAYGVYRPDGTALSAAPVRETSFTDKAIEWGTERCYEVRSVSIVEGARVESAASPQQCVTLRDTFAPARPEGLVGVGSVGAISLIWTANKEPDLGGYVVLRAVAPATALTPVTPEPIAETNFRDTVPAGATVSYAVIAVDKAGNRSAPSERIVESAR